VCKWRMTKEGIDEKDGTAVGGLLSTRCPGNVTHWAIELSFRPGTIVSCMIGNFIDPVSSMSDLHECPSRSDLGSTVPGVPSTAAMTSLIVSPLYAMPRNKLQNYEIGIL
jgi:hypothetical protein